MNRALACLTLILVITGANGTTALETDCREIEDPQQRLACYDARDEASKTSVEAKSPSRSETRDTADQPQTEAFSSTQQATDSKDEPEQRTTSKRTLFGYDVIELTTRVAAVRKGDRQKMVFRLENDEIWMQTEPRLLPIYEGDVVTIENATMGGYFLSSEKGVVTRVQRISETNQ